MTFFFNDIYSEPILFNSSQGWLNPGFTLRLQLGVGLDGFKRPFPANLSRLSWKCPAYVIDYLRVYQIVNLANEKNVYSNCEAILKNSNEGALQNICQMARGSEATYLGATLTTTESPKKAFDNSASSTFTFSLSLNWLLGFTLCLALSILVIYLLVKKTSTPAIDLSNQRVPIEASEDQYEIPLYEVYESQADRPFNGGTSRDYVAIKS